MALDGRPFDIDFYVVDAEPAVWFDCGYRRHDGGIFGDVSTEMHWADDLGYQTNFPLP
jgi:hypothetical protein